MKSESLNNIWEFPLGILINYESIDSQFPIACIYDHSYTN